ncbi:hypothetical protein NL676_025566 [Syzygium grande]|nr:hypothetical protein NL676_025566 [Syzygium grande]
MCRSLLLFLSLLLSLLLAASAHGGDHDEDSSSSSDERDQHVDMRSKYLIIAKIRCLILVFVCTFIGGVLPYLLKWNEAFLLLGTHFAVGLFLGTALMRFPMDAIKTFSDLTENEYPFSLMLPIAGVLLTMLADFAISYIYSKREEEQSSRCNGDLAVSGGTEQRKGSSANGDTHHHHKAKVAIGSPSILLIIVLCFHSVFEGIAIGVAKTKADAWRALWTIFPHNTFAAIAMGIALLCMMPNRPLLSCVANAFSFAISIPTGVVIGITIEPTMQGAVAGWIFAISMGLARGMFIYVSTSHLLSKWYVPQSEVSVDKPIQKFLAIVLGCGVIAVLMIWDAFGCSAAVFLNW